MNLLFDRPKGRDLQSYDYSRLDEEATQDLISSVAMLMDSVFETTNGDFGLYLSENRAEASQDPGRLFEKMFAALEDHPLSRGQASFRDICKTNVAAIFRWYKKNGRTVNVSPKQRHWFERWFGKHGIPTPRWSTPVGKMPKISLKGDQND